MVRLGKVFSCTIHFWGLFRDKWVIKIKSTESLKVREQMVDMHQFFIDKIDEAVESQRYIEASWLIYSCIENRFFRILQKYKKQCKYCKGKSKCKKNRNELAISTKIACVERFALFCLKFT